MKGVYQIKNIISGKKYIGSSVDIKNRWNVHKYKLNRGCHENPHLQNAWNKYGKDAFVFETLEETDNTLEREQWYLDNVVEWGQDYNIGKVATAAQKGRALSEETKRKMSEEHKGENGPNASLTNEQVWQIHTLYATGNYTLAQLEERFHVSQSHVSRILRGESWPHIYEKFKGENYKKKNGEVGLDKQKRKCIMAGSKKECTIMRNKQIFRLIEKEGATYKEAGKRYSISKQRVGQIYRRELERRGIEETYSKRNPHSAVYTESLSTLVTKATKERVLKKTSNISQWLRNLVKEELTP